MPESSTALIRAIAYRKPGGLGDARSGR